MKITAHRFVAAGALFGLAALLSAAFRTHAEDIKVVRTMVSISNARFGNYWPTPTAKEPVYNTWSWLPRASFYLKGTMPPGAQVSIAYMLPDGKPWLTVPLVANKVGESDYYACGHDYSSQEAGKPAKTIVGTFPFKITLKDPLAGSNTVLYTGKYTVGKFHKGNALPAFKNQFEYYVDQDWRLPIAFVAPDYSDSYRDNPALQVKLYLKGEVDQERLEGVLMYDGKVIASKELRGSGTYSKFMLTTTGMDKGDPLWRLWNFSFGGVRLTVPEYNRMDTYWYLSEHPGEYELKVLRDGTLARSVKFTVAEGGKFVDNGMGEQANDEANAIVPAKIVGATDGKWDAKAWKEEAFYGNPLTGFEAP
ncbi:hypothetical protein EON81_08320 [bacterium]|nr:MAG: hypothetical protein EON81_08320 [bacterium]